MATSIEDSANHIGKDVVLHLFLQWHLECHIFISYTDFLFVLAVDIPGNDVYTYYCNNRDQYWVYGYHVWCDWWHDFIWQVQQEWYKVSVVTSDERHPNGTEVLFNHIANLNKLKSVLIHDNLKESGVYETSNNNICSLKGYYLFGIDIWVSHCGKSNRHLFAIKNYRHEKLFASEDASITIGTTYTFLSN